MLVHVECAKPTFNMLALLNKNCNAFSHGHPYFNTAYFTIFINRNFSLSCHTADIIADIISL